MGGGEEANADDDIVLLGKIGEMGGGGEVKEDGENIAKSTDDFSRDDGDDQKIAALKGGTAKELRQTVSVLFKNMLLR